jgi:adenosylmethionine-8-amino-7-oxononanoate aminotransferase
MQLGYTRPDLIAVMAETAARLPHARPSAFDSPEGESYREALLRAAGPPFTRVLLTSSGSEAVEVAIKAAWWFQRARGAPHRREVLSLAGHYHGATLAALDATGYAARRAPFAGLLGERAFGPTPDAALEKADRAAAFLCETIPAAGLAASVPPRGWMSRIRERCDAEGALWVADEVLTGFGRTGALFAWPRIEERDGAKAAPDMVVFGKGASAGFYPLAGVLVSERVAAALEDEEGGVFHHAQTFGGNPVACAVGKRALQAFDEEGVFERVRRAEADARRVLQPLLENESVLDVRGMGFLWGVELAAPGEGRPAFPRARCVAEKVVHGCRARGVLVHAATGFNADGSGDAILIAPPLIAEADSLNVIAVALKEAVEVLLPRGDHGSWVEEWEDR